MGTPIPAGAPNNAQQALLLVERYELGDSQAKALSSIIDHGVTPADVKAAKEVYEGLISKYPGKHTRNQDKELADSHAFVEAVQGALETKQLREAIASGDFKTAGQLINTGTGGGGPEANGSFRPAVIALSGQELDTLVTNVSPEARSNIGWSLAYDNSTPVPTLSRTTRDQLYASLIAPEQRVAFDSRFPRPEKQ